MTDLPQLKQRIDDIVCGLGGARYKTRLDASRRVYHIPTPPRGYLRLTVTLRPRWCDIDVDRWPTTDRRTELAGPWLAEHIEPLVDANLRVKRRGYGIVPAGGPSYTGAYPLTGEQVADVLGPWLRHELTDWHISQAEYDAAWLGEASR